ncbi:hypothetical protein [Nostoc commune]|uniref:hypothetical protein n=1 Tax=Nostoc commune TaxID=1178 RepID=UPI0020738557|nr:hypothetical protein [Nostoc commune]
MAQTAAGIANIINTDEYEVEEVLESWLEFLHQEQIDGETHIVSIIPASVTG